MTVPKRSSPKPGSVPSAPHDRSRTLIPPPGPHSGSSAPSSPQSLMERASAALIARRYHECQSLCVRALDRAVAARDLDSAARILLPLEECRRQVRDDAFDSGRVFVVDSALPLPEHLLPGCYLICPPRVGADAVVLRELAAAHAVPAIIVAREPQSLDGLWPIVAVGPVTLRTKVTPPDQTELVIAVRFDSAGVPIVASDAKTERAPARSGTHLRAVARSGAQPRAAARRKAQFRAPPTVAPVRSKQSKHTLSPPPVPHDSHLLAPPPTWFVRANESLGDAALRSLDASAEPLARIIGLLNRLKAHPDHEKLHQALHDELRAAARIPPQILWSARHAALRGDEIDDASDSN